nr:hypothetical protein [Williamsia herbipolensis]
MCRDPDTLGLRRQPRQHPVDHRSKSDGTTDGGDDLGVDVGDNCSLCAEFVDQSVGELDE